MERQMASMGVLVYKGMGTEPGAVDKWIEDFLALEAAGWKGRAGTAFAVCAADRAYFTQLIRNAQVEGRLMALGLYLDGRPVAMKANLLARDGGFCFKICFDDAFAKYSPGVLLELENIREAHRMGLVWMDSCADQDHPMIDRLWPDRRQIQTVFLAPRLLGHCVHRRATGGATSNQALAGSAVQTLSAKRRTAQRIYRDPERATQRGRVLTAMQAGLLPVGVPIVALWRDASPGLLCGPIRPFACVRAGRYGGVHPRRQREWGDHRSGRQAYHSS